MRHSRMFRFSWWIFMYLCVILFTLSDQIPATANTRSSSTKKPSVQPQKPSGQKTGSGTIVSFRLGPADSGRCQCVLFYQCDVNDVVTVSDSSSPVCNINQEVCCRLPNDFGSGSSIDSTTSSGGVPSSTSESVPSSTSGSVPLLPGDLVTTESSGSSGAIFGPGSDSVSSGSSTQEPCTCVPEDQCADDSIFSGAGLIDVRVTPCRAGEVCCVSGGEQQGGNVSPAPSADVCDCGIRRNDENQYNVATRIISTAGDESSTLFGEFPWMGVILKTDQAEDGKKTENVFQCGASLLSPSILLTAAHCLIDVDVNALKARLGEYDTHLGAKKEPLPHQDRTIATVSIHPNFNSGSLYNDVALAVTTQPFNLTDNVNTICLPDKAMFQGKGDPIYDPNNCVATGWGKNSFEQEGRFQTTLKKVQLSVVDKQQCEKKLRSTRLGTLFKLHSSFICAGGSPGKDTCQGDGGGPLICPVKEEKRRYVQTGIVSWGIGCGSDVPGVYASTEANLAWILSEIDNVTAGGIFRIKPH